MFEWKRISKGKLTPTEWLVVAAGGIVAINLLLRNTAFRAYAVTDGVRFNAVGDFDKADDGRTIQNAISGGPQAILMLGDFGYSTKASSWVKGTAKPLLDSGIPLLGTLGNHDSSKDYLKYIFSKYGQKSWNYRKTIGNTRFLAVNTQKPSMSYTTDRLKEAQADPNLAWVIPYMHKAIYTPAGSHHPAEVSQKYHTLFTQYPKVKLVLQAHNHNYFRMKPRDGITYVQVGTGGRTPYNDASDANTEVHISPVFGVLKCQTSQSSISCQFVDNSGAVRDSFTVQ